MSIIDRAFLQRTISKARTTKVSSVQVRGIGKEIHKYDEYIELSIYLSNKSQTAFIRREAQIVDNLKANLLVSIDILGSKSINLILSQSIMIIGSCQGIRILIDTKTRESQRIKRVVLTKKQTTIPARSVMTIPIQFRGETLLPANRDFLFNPVKAEIGIDKGVAASIVNANTINIITRNTSNRPVIISRKQRLGITEEYSAEDCYHVAIPNKIRALASGPISWKSNALIN